MERVILPIPRAPIEVEVTGAWDGIKFVAVSTGNLEAVERELAKAHAEIERLRAVERRYGLLRDAVNQDASECDPGCDGHGHTKTCKFVSIAALVEDRQAEIERLKGVVVAEGVVQGIPPRWYVKVGDGTFHFTDINLSDHDGQHVEVIIRKAAL